MLPNNSPHSTAQKQVKENISKNIRGISTEEKKTRQYNTNQNTHTLHFTGHCERFIQRIKVCKSKQGLGMNKETISIMNRVSLNIFIELKNNVAAFFLSLDEPLLP